MSSTKINPYDCVLFITEGQTLAKRIGKQLMAASQKVNKAIKTYNAVPAVGSMEPPHTLQRSDVIDLTADVWQYMESPLPTLSSVPPPVKRRLVNAFLLNKRAKEEERYIRDDMDRVLAGYEQNIKTLENICAKDVGNATIALVRQKKMMLEAKAHLMESLISKSAPSHMSVEDFVESTEQLLVDEHSSSDVTPELLQSVLQEIEDIEADDDNVEDDSDDDESDVTTE